MYVFVFILFESQWEKEGEKSSIYRFISQMLIITRAGSSQSRELGTPAFMLGSNYLSHCLLLPKVHFGRKLEWKVEWGLELRCSDRG